MGDFGLHSTFLMIFLFLLLVDHNFVRKVIIYENEKVERKKKLGFNHSVWNILRFIPNRKIILYKNGRVEEDNGYILIHSK